MSFVINWAVIYIVKMLKEPTVTREEKYMLVYSFYLQFFNNCVLLLLLQSNFSEGNLPILSKIINKGISGDWDQNWYKMMGPVLAEMVIMTEI